MFFDKHYFPGVMPEAAVTPNVVDGTGMKFAEVRIFPGFHKDFICKVYNWLAVLPRKILLADLRSGQRAHGRHSFWWRFCPVNDFLSRSQGVAPEWISISFTRAAKGHSNWTQWFRWVAEQVFGSFMFCNCSKLVTGVWCSKLIKRSITLPLFRHARAGQVGHRQDARLLSDGRRESATTTPTSTVDRGADARNCHSNRADDQKDCSSLGAYWVGHSRRFNFTALILSSCFPVIVAW